MPCAASAAPLVVEEAVAPPSPIAVHGRAADGDATYIAIDAVSTDLRGLLQALARAGGLNVVLRDDVQGSVTIQLQPMALRDALEMVAVSGGYGWTRSGSITFVGGPPPVVRDGLVCGR